LDILNAQNTHPQREGTINNKHINNKHTYPNNVVVKRSN